MIQIKDNKVPRENIFKKYNNSTFFFIFKYDYIIISYYN